MITYLCGGINGLGDAECRDWREVAKELLQTDTLDPMRRDYRGKEDESVTQIVGGDLDDIRQSQIILINATRPSWGTAMEIVYAQQYGKVTVAFTEGARVSPWLRFHCGTIVSSLDEAVRAINAYAAAHTKTFRGR